MAQLHSVSMDLHMGSFTLSLQRSPRSVLGSKRSLKELDTKSSQSLPEIQLGNKQRVLGKQNARGRSCT